MPVVNAAQAHFVGFHIDMLKPSDDRKMARNLTKLPNVNV